MCSFTKICSAILVLDRTYGGSGRYPEHNIHFCNFSWESHMIYISVGGTVQWISLGLLNQSPTSGGEDVLISINVSYLCTMQTSRSWLHRGSWLQLWPQSTATSNNPHEFVRKDRFERLRKWPGLLITLSEWKHSTTNLHDSLRLYELNAFFNPFHARLSAESNSFCIRTYKLSLRRNVNGYLKESSHVKARSFFLAIPHTTDMLWRQTGFKAIYLGCSMQGTEISMFSNSLVCDISIFNIMACETNM